jgi:DNA-binding MarR family transcriptional regulator
MAIDLNNGIRLGFFAHDVARLQRVVQDRLLKPLGLTRSQWSVLIFLSRRDGMTQTALAADLDLTRAAIGGLLERMESAGVIQRRSDELDARIRRVYLTRAGHRLLGEIRRIIEPVVNTTLEPNTDAEIAVALPVLRRMRTSLLGLLGEEGGERQTKGEHSLAEQE